MWSYIVETTERSIRSVKNFFWFVKFAILALYVLFCVGVAAYTYVGGVSLTMLIAVGLDLALFVAAWIITNVIHKCSNEAYLRLRSTLGVIRISQIFIRIFGAVMLFVNNFIAIEVGAGSLGIRIVFLIFSCGLLTFIVIKELVVALVKYVKYKAKKEFNRFKRAVMSERIEAENVTYDNRIDN